tara:strand:- start:583 stop:2187 length:1605 start_codon:yes stop_codon:yes gene_type:complete
MPKEAICNINRANGTLLFSVLGVVRESEESWKITLTKTDMALAGSFRLRKAISSIVGEDAAIIHRLQSGKKVERTIQKINSGLNFERSELIRPLLLPSIIKDERLYDFQRTGVAWLINKDRAILADDMGLGKTAQALSAVRRLFRFGKIENCLVVAPGTLITNWEKESKFWAPELAVTKFLPKGEERKFAWNQARKKANLIVTSYEQIRKPSDQLFANPPSIIIADEAHRLRKSNSQSTKGLSLIAVGKLWALTGTPIENDSEDIAVLLSLMFPKRFTPGDKNRRISTLRENLRPHLMRRTKSDVLAELPDLIEHEEIVELGPNQLIAYKKTIKDFRLKKHNERSHLALFNQLREICDLDPNSGESAKLDRIIQILQEIEKIGEKAVIFSYTLGPLRSLSTRLKQIETNSDHGVITGEMTLSERDIVIEKFKSDSKCNVLLASSKVASEGLTLTEANHVLFINRWWNPSANLQARDRVLRIGQDKVVYVRNFVAAETVESRVSEILQDKSKTFDELITALETSPNESLFQQIIE